MNPLVSVPARPQEALLVALIPSLGAKRILCNTGGRGQFALEAARADSGRRVSCHFLDLYQLQQCRATAGEIPANLALMCQADFPPGPFDLVALAFNKQGDGELARDLLQSAHEALEIGGQLAVTSDNSNDEFFHNELRKLFAKVTRRPSSEAVLYQATRTGPLKKMKNFACEFPFRDGERLIQMRTRPGVFSHRRLDGGARALINEMRIWDCGPDGNQKNNVVLDLGCGSGAVAISAALRGPQVIAIDSNPRAIEATLWAAEKSSVGSRLTAILDCDGSSVGQEICDVVLANPPYFSNNRIAEHFVRTAHKALRAGGHALFVTKTPNWYLEQLPKMFAMVGPKPGKNYTIVAARR